MQLSLWKRETLEALVRDLQQENLRLKRINWGRVIALGFFIFYGITVWNYLTSPEPSTKSSNCSVQAKQSSK